MDLAARFDGEIVSVDSMQVYRGMDIGTAKPTTAERESIPHHLVDIADPAEDFSVSEFQVAGRVALEDVATRGTAIIAGGTGLHFRALVDPLDFPPTDAAVRRDLEALDVGELRRRLLALDPTATEHVDVANPRRVIRAVEIHELTGETPTKRATSREGVAVRRYEPSVPFVGIGVDPGDVLRQRIVERFDAMLASGLLDEVAGLASRLGRVASQAVGYKELLPVVKGAAPLEEGRQAAIDATAALAKRQRTFFRRDPRITWLDPGTSAQAAFDRSCEIIEERGQD